MRVFEEGEGMALGFLQKTVPSLAKAQRSSELLVETANRTGETLLCPPTPKPFLVPVKAIL